MNNTTYQRGYQRSIEMENEKVKRVQELRRSNAATAIPSKKKYKRKIKNKKEKVLQYYSDLVSPFFK